MLCVIIVIFLALFERMGRIQVIEKAVDNLKTFQVCDRLQICRTKQMHVVLDNPVRERVKGVNMYLVGFGTNKLDKAFAHCMYTRICKG